MSSSSSHGRGSLYPIHDRRNPAHEVLRRRVVQKLDWNTLPALSFLWMVCFLDRANIGNAKVAGLVEDLDLKGIQFNIALAVFYIGYISVEIPSNYILRRVGARIWLPLLVLSWGVVTIFGAFVTNFASLIVVRILLGIFEGGLLPGMVFFLSTLYKQEELQFRIAIFYVFTPLSGAFGGLLAFEIQKMAGIGGKPAWAWIFILEGSLTVLAAIFGWCFIASSASTARFLNEEERHFAVNRMRVAHVALERKSEKLPKQLEAAIKHEEDVLRKHNSETSCSTEDFGEPFEWSECRRALLDPQVWMLGMSAATSSVAAYSFSFFLPTLVKGMGHVGAEAQLYSAFPYLSASVLVLLCALLADKWRTRIPIILTLFPVSMSGYIMAACSESIHVRYAGVFLMAAGIFPAIPCYLCLIPSNVSGLTKRATATALGIMLGNLSGFVAPFIYTPDQAPRYVKGHTIALGFICVSWTLALANVIYCLKENAARKAGKRDHLAQKYYELVNDGKTQAPIGDRDPKFLFTL